MRTFFPFGSMRSVLRGPARGLRFVVEPGIGLTYAIGTEAAAPRHFRTRIRPGMVVYDVGANKGQMALLFARLVGPAGRVVSFEPAPAEAASLVRNVALNGFGDCVRLVVAAASDRDGTLRFAYPNDSPTQGKLLDVEPTYTHARADEFEVDAVRLDSVVQDERPPDVIKLDVEGAAASVLRGAASLLDTHAPRIFVELHGPEEQAGIRDELLGRGYVAHTLDGRRVTDPTAGWFSPLWCHRPSA